MDYDKNIAALFLLNLGEAYRSAKHLLSSHERLARLMPLSAEQLAKLNVDDLEMLDAFRVRYCDLQDALGNKTFRSLLKLEEEQPGSNLDTLNKMEKRSIIHSFDAWKELRDIRNLFSHDYPETDEEKAQALSIAYSNTLKLVETVDNVIRYIKDKVQISMEQFPLLLPIRGET